MAEHSGSWLCWPSGSCLGGPPDAGEAHHLGSFRCDAWRISTTFTHVVHLRIDGRMCQEPAERPWWR